MDVDNTIERFVNTASFDIGSCHITVQVEMNWVAPKTESLPNICKLQIRNAIGFNRNLRLIPFDVFLNKTSIKYITHSIFGSSDE